ncbi:hypothetical protein MIR68_008671 [Amoeboaphelidium protococcarum]|nr:hypothetical protein MIR68_008671 [Amoeboaphelidium protococcarum]
MTVQQLGDMAAAIGYSQQQQQKEPLRSAGRSENFSQTPYYGEFSAGDGSRHVPQSQFPVPQQNASLDNNMHHSHLPDSHSGHVNSRLPLLYELLQQGYDQALGQPTGVSSTPESNASHSNSLRHDMASGVNHYYQGSQNQPQFQLPSIQEFTKSTVKKYIISADHLSLEPVSVHPTHQYQVSQNDYQFQSQRSVSSNDTSSRSSQSEHPVSVEPTSSVKMHNHPLTKIRSSSGGDLFICNWENCGKEFKKYYNLKSHLKIHTGERPFACDFDGCSAAFTRRHDLNRHRKTHSGEREYQCSDCGRKFSRQDALTRHLNGSTCKGGAGMHGELQRDVQGRCNHAEVQSTYDHDQSASSYSNSYGVQQVYQRPIVFVPVNQYQYSNPRHYMEPATSKPHERVSEEYSQGPSVPYRYENLPQYHARTQDTVYRPSNEFRVNIR